MARNNDFENKSFSNLTPNVIRGWTNKSGTRRFGKKENALSMSISVPVKNYGAEESEYHFLELRFFDDRADAIEANFGEGGPLSGGGIPVIVIPGPMFIESYEGRLGSNYEPAVISIDGEEYSSEDVEIRGERFRYSMNPLDIGVSLSVNVVNDGFDMESIFQRDDNDDDEDDDEEGGRGGRSKRSSSRRSKRSSSRTSRRSRRDEKEEEEDDYDDADEDAEDEDFDESDDDADEDADDVDDAEDEDDEEEEEERPRSRSSRRGRSGRRSSSRRGRR